MKRIEILLEMERIHAAKTILLNSNSADKHEEFKPILEEMEMALIRLFKLKNLAES